MANSNNWGEIYKSTWWGDKAWSANTLFIDSAPPGFGLNLLKASEDMDNTIDWRQVLSSVVANSTDEAAPDGTDTAEKITFTDDRQARIQQKIDLEANTTYTFSVYAKVRTGTKDFRLRNLTLGEQGAFTADTSWGLNPDDGRYSFSFTTGATAITHTLSIQNAASAGTGEVFFWGAMLNEGATAGDYVKTDASVGGSAPTPAYSGFGDAFGGATAYYSLRKFTEAETLNAIRVRRSSDDTEQDIGFDANGDLDSTALTTFVNEDITQYNYSTATQMVADFATVKGAESVDSVGGEEALKFTVEASSGTHFLYRFNIFGGSGECSISFDYYLPSTNADMDGIQMNDSSNDIGATQTTQDAWTSATVSGNLGATAIYIYGVDGGAKSFVGNGTDVFYIKNLAVTQTAADGAVTTWYDQSGNGNDATNSTASEQPLVVSGGTLVTENGKAAIDFDGVDDELGFLADISATEVSSVIVAKAITHNINNRFFGWRNSTHSFLSVLMQRGSSTELRGLSQTSVSSQQLEYSGVDCTNQSLISMYNASVWRMNGNEFNTATTAATTGVRSTNGLTLGSRGDGSNHGNVRFQEAVFFDSDQSSNRGSVSLGTGIEGNINTYFDIV